MSTVNVTLRIDDKLKSDAEALFTDLGLSFNSAMNVFLRQSVREQRIPFTLKRDIPNDVTLTAIEEVRQMKEKNKPIGKTYTNVDSMMEDILS